jgi:hypothetical protein
MSPRLLRLAAAAVLLAAAAGAWSWWRSPERRLARRLDALVELLEKEGEEGSLPAAATARAAVDFFAPGFLVRARPYEGTLADPRELTGAVLRFRAAAPRVAIQVADREVEVAPGERTGTVVFVATVTLEREGAGPGRESWRVRSLWVQDAGEWRISELELAERLGGGLLLPF